MSAYRTPGVRPEEPPRPVVRPRRYPIGFFMTIADAHHFLVQAKGYRSLAVLVWSFAFVLATATAYVYCG